jgi:CheY-like chemotaxis protein
LLRRTLGEDVDLRIALDRSVRPVRVDRGQVEQVLLNLAVNARDAMPTGGTLVIDTAGVVVDEDYATRHPGVELGPYVRLRVSDTGTGMDAATVDRALEPFFTTKPVGQGTGLGLSTVHGIVQKAGGHLRIYSEPGIGTTITVELPAEEREVALDEAAPAPASVTDVRGGTVLVVEDDDALRDVTRRVLERNGYDVLSASNGPDAIVIAREHPGDIDLLLTDVILPDLTGKDTADRVLAIRPGLPVVYMSGYAEPLLASRGTLDAGIVLVHKPFSEHDLMAHIAQAMHVRR